MSELDWKKIIKKNELFNTLSNVEIEQLLNAETVTEKSYEIGDAIIRHGEHGRNFFLIGEGSVKISTPGPEGCDIELAILESGEFFGEMSLLRQQPRTATVTAREDCIVLRINADNLRSLLNQRPDILASIFILLSERMRYLAESVINVSYHEVDHKLELFSMKLDAELKAMNSTLAASQAVFDQTTTRANEVISSSERHRSRVTILGSTAATVLTLLVGTLGWFGFDSMDNVKAKISGSIEQAQTDMQNAKKRMDDNIKEVESQNESFTAHYENVLKSAKEIEILKTDLEDNQLELQTGAGYSVVSILEKLPKVNSNGKKYYIGTLKKNIKVALAKNQEDNATLVFKGVYNWITSVMLGAKSEDDIHEERRYIASVLRSVVDSPNNIPERNRVLAYYFLLASLAIEGNQGDYEFRRNELSAILRTASSGVLLEDDMSNFEPAGFALALESLELPPAMSKDILQKIEAVWQKASGI